MTDVARIRDCLDRALLAGGDRHDFFDDVVPRLTDGRAQWWQHGDGVAITEVMDYPKRKELNCWLVAGRLRDCQALQPEIEAWAIAQGITRVVGLGRFGWTRVAAKMGFLPWGVALRKELA